MITTSPERKSIGMGSTSRLRPPIRNIAAFPSLYVVFRKVIYRICIMTYEIDTRGVVDDISERSTWPMSVSYKAVV